MVQKLDFNPYVEDISQCEHLLKYCRKNLPKEEQEENRNINEIITETDKNELEEKRKKKIEEDLSKGKLQRALTKEEKL